MNLRAPVGRTIGAAAIAIMLISGMMQKVAASPSEMPALVATPLDGVAVDGLAAI